MGVAAAPAARASPPLAARRRRGPRKRARAADRRPPLDTTSLRPASLVATPLLLVSSRSLLGRSCRLSSRSTSRSSWQRGFPRLRDLLVSPGHPPLRHPSPAPPGSSPAPPPLLLTHTFSRREARMHAIRKGRRGRRAGRRTQQVRGRRLGRTSCRRRRRRRRRSATGSGGAAGGKGGGGVRAASSWAGCAPVPAARFQTPLPSASAPALAADSSFALSPPFELLSDQHLGRPPLPSFPRPCRPCLRYASLPRGRRDPV